MNRKERRKWLNHINSHGKLVTRRDFMSMGLMGASAMMCAPLFPITSFAQEQSKKVLNDMGFLVFDLAGGAGLVGNFLVGNKGGPEDLIKSYETLGWNPRQDKIDYRFGLPMPASDISKILAGIVGTCSKEAQANLRFGSLCHAASSDSSSNKLSAFGLVLKAGDKGEITDKALGSNDSLSGGRSRDPLEEKKYKPIYINEPLALQSLFGESAAFGSVPKDPKQKFLEDFGKLSREKNSRFAKLYKGLGSEKIIQIDPRQIKMTKDIYNLSEDSRADSQDVIFATITNSVVNKVSGPGVLYIGGCDYHNNGQASTDAKDLEIGQQIGRAVEVAHQSKKKLFIQIITDGGIYARSNSREWQGDSDDRCMTVIGCYDPSGPVQYRDAKNMQIGHYSNGEGAERSTLIGNNPTLVAYAVFANYLSLNDRLNEFETLAPGIFTSKQLDEVLIF